MSVLLFGIFVFDLGKSSFVVRSFEVGIDSRNIDCRTDWRCRRDNIDLQGSIGLTYVSHEQEQLICLAVILVDWMNLYQSTSFGINIVQLNRRRNITIYFNLVLERVIP